MGGKATPWTHTGITTEEVTVKFGPSKSVVTVPAGTQCVMLEGGTPRWVVQDLSFLEAQKDSITYHDADHYGIDIGVSHITGILAVGPSIAGPLAKTAPRAPAPIDSERAYYGRATLHPAADQRAAEAAMRRCGVEYSDFDHRSHSYPVRVSLDAYLLLAELSEHCKFDLHIRVRPDDEWLPNVKLLDTTELSAERAFCEYRIACNDGRLTSGSSAELDMLQEQIEDIDKREKTPTAPAAQPRVNNGRTPELGTVGFYRPDPGGHAPYMFLGADNGTYDILVIGLGITMALDADEWMSIDEMEASTASVLTHHRDDLDMASRMLSERMRTLADAHRFMATNSRASNLLAVLDQRLTSAVSPTGDRILRDVAREWAEAERTQLDGVNRVIRNRLDELKALGFDNGSDYASNPAKRDLLSNLYAKEMGDVLQATQKQADALSLQLRRMRAQLSAHVPVPDNDNTPSL